MLLIIYCIVLGILIGIFKDTINLELRERQPWIESTTFWGIIFWPVGMFILLGTLIKKKFL